VLRAKASLEVTKEMRARIRALSAVLAILGLVAPGGAYAQAPAAAETAAAQARTAVPPEGTLPLSLDEAVARAMESNVDIAVQQYNPELSVQNVRAAEGYYDPFLFSTLSHTSSDTKGTSSISGGSLVNAKTDVWNFGVALPVKTGADLSIAFNNNKRDSTSNLATFNPNYNSSLSLSLTQPLLRDFKIDAPRQALRVAKKNREITDVEFRQSVINTLATVKGYYYELLFEIDNLVAAQKNLDLAKKLLEENEIRVKVGTMAPLDVVTAQSEVAAREEGVILAENALANAEDNLKSVIFPKNDPAMWSTRIVPTDRPTAEPVPVDIEAAVRNAIENRTDMVSARKSLERYEYSVQYTKNQLLPTVDLTAGYGAAGAGGTELIRDPPFSGPVVDTIPGGYGDALDEVFGRDYPTWSVGLQLSYAIPNRSQKAGAAAARINRDQALASYRRLELQVAAEVRTAARGVESGFKRVASTQAARRLAAERLDAEEKKFAAGMSTNFLVTQAQRDLAEQQVNELRAVADYRKSVINYQRVQEAGVSGSGVVTVLSGTSGGAQSNQALRSAGAASAF
jgi:outer membrane protein TolC